MNVIHKPASRQARQAHQHWERGVAQSRKGQWGEALRAFEAAIKISPKDDVYLVNAAKAALESDRIEQALDYSMRALARNPASEVALFIRVAALQRLQNHAETLAYLQSVPEERRNSREYWSALGCALQNTGKQQEAIAAFMEALTLQMDDAISHYRMGISFYEMQLKEEASECFRTSLILGLGPNALHVHGMLAYAERESCRWVQAAQEEANMRSMVDALDDKARVMTAPFAHVTLTDDPLHQLKACRLMSNNFADIKPVVRRERVRHGERIRVGYVSADFHQHATSVLMAEVFEHHDRSRFEVFLYSHGPDDKTAMRQRIEAAAEHFVELAGASDQDIAQRIADDQLDLLIDLKGYTAQNRMGVFARRPAPVQATYLGFPGTTGSSFVDYIIGDPIVTPLAHEAHFSEKIAQLPVCYQPNDRQRPRPQPMSRKAAGLPEDALVLCGFNQAYKISPEVLDVWCGFLQDIPNAVLWLLDWHGQARPHLEEELSVRGVDLARIRWAPRLGLADHINRTQLADIFIDAWPCNAHTTASDALWSGLPVVTYMGRTFASRVAGSLLNAVGLSELATETLDAYRAKVLALAADPAERARIRAHLAEARDQAPLFDSARYTGDLERLLERMVLRHEQGLPVDHLSGLPAA
ncbi:glycosyltransferase family 41 protein [Aquabacterium sp.]|jgi:predicted O-linked N-acetylglucosamine transferase (SPINDLY family)|uniref:O-linked N-acetylglucosamine transferase, SPINDLY family protein n=1 Tax=Aquabacterium sp. TaxID=1872578 RepID=UPI0025C0CB15|nr:glycosyltransferase family 41 protein [Aquabacterium sp.]